MKQTLWGWLGKFLVTVQENSKLKQISLWVIKRILKQIALHVCLCEY